MAKGIEEKDFSGIQVAHELQNIASKKPEDARKGLEDLNKRKRKLMDQLEKYAKKKKIWIELICVEISVCKISLGMVCT